MKRRCSEKDEVKTKEREKFSLVVGLEDRCVSTTLSFLTRRSDESGIKSNTEMYHKKNCGSLTFACLCYNVKIMPLDLREIWTVMDKNENKSK